ncbi:elastinolytic metalloproteinase Mep [Metarhizium rileyi]|uniref:Extracellular metalloproteinase n=1 Tax=Metarhizium rileyi (strain RCEF 4871) TaxID=1649241 RepID=A0A167KCZ3_METRR|nr:elastinolytic metalloproteinase Mep [Metarhizium rileyi RCEF 4871]
MKSAAIFGLTVFAANENPQNGRLLTMKLVMRGMPIQPCNPNMVSAHYATLEADKLLTGSANRCLLWEGFVKRSLGVKAKYDGGRDRVEDFTVPQRMPKVYIITRADMRGITTRIVFRNQNLMFVKVDDISHSIERRPRAGPRN